jgi:peroxiredoxin
MSAPFVVSYVLLWLLVLFQGALVLGLLRLVAALRSHDVHSPPAGQEDALRGRPLPEFRVTDLSGDTIESSVLADRPSAALLFVSTGCPSCGVTLEELDALKSKVDGNVLVVCRGTDAECGHLADSYELTVPVTVDSDLRLSRLLQVPGVPTALLLEDGVIKSYGQPMSREEVEELVAGVTADGQPTVSGG